MDSSTSSPVPRFRGASSPSRAKIVNEISAASTGSSSSSGSDSKLSQAKQRRGGKGQACWQRLLTPMNIGILITCISVVTHLTRHFSRSTDRQRSEHTSKHSWQTKARERVVKTMPSKTKSSSSKYEATPIVAHQAQEEKEFLELDPLLTQSADELATRYLRFPSVQDRVKIYMSNWYTPPCPGNEQALARYFYIDDQNKPATTTTSRVLFREVPHQHPEPAGDDFGKVRPFNVSHEVISARVFHLDRNTILDCQTEYCVDTIQYYVPAIDRIDAAANDDSLPVPTLAQFGDSDTPRAFTPSQAVGEFPQVPVVMKFRFRFQGESDIHDMTSRQQECIAGVRPMLPTVDVPGAANGISYFQPIVWRLTSHRHYGMMDQIPDADIPWTMKKNVAVWRGALTGIFRDGFKLGMLKSKPPREICLLMHRCKLVLMNGKSKLVDAKLAHGDSSRQLIPQDIEGISMYGTKMAYSDMLQYKAIIMLEGNDISSGFKWALYSNSVVMTQRPTKTSWAMEELLQPWVHYVPLNDDLTDVEEKMQWVLDHDEEAQDIARRGSLWIQDLLYHPDVVRDEEKIYDEMMRRYRAHFVEDPSLVDLAVEYGKNEEMAKQKKRKKHNAKPSTQEGGTVEEI